MVNYLTNLTASGIIRRRRIMFSSRWCKSTQEKFVN